MISKLLSASVLLLATSPVCGQDKAPTVILPGVSAPAPTPAGPVRLSAKQLYVARSNLPCLVIASPDGILRITQPTGGKVPSYIDGDGSYQIKAEVTVKVAAPLELRAVFSDGDGTVQSKVFAEKNVWCIEAVGTGTCELLFIVDGGKEIVRQVIEANNGPRPPDPPSPTALLKHLTFVGAETRPAAIAVNNDAGLRAWLKAAGVNVHVLLASDPAIAAKGMAPAVVKAGGVPCVVLQDEAGRVIGQGPITSVEAVKTLASEHIRR